MRFLRSVGVFLVCAVSAAAQTGAPIERRKPQPQQPAEQQPTYTIRADSRLVNVAVNVVDEHGSPVGGLTQEDFQVYEDERPQKIAFFDKESATPLAMVLAMDASESTFGDDKLEHDAAKAFAKSILRPQDRMALLSFADSVDEVVGFTSDVRAIDTGLGHMQRGDATALYDAIYLASQRLSQAPPAPNQRRVIVLITDGENTTHHGSYPQALEEAERAGAMVYSLIVVPVLADAGRNSGGEHALIQMARDTGGRFYYVYQKRDLAPALAHVSEDLRTQYALAYQPPDRGVSPTGQRRIQVKLKDAARCPGCTLRYRTVYYADREPPATTPE